MAAAVPPARARLQADRCRLDHFGHLHVPVAAVAQRLLDHASPSASGLEPARLPRQRIGIGAADRGLCAAAQHRDVGRAPARLRGDRLRGAQPDHDLRPGGAWRRGAGGPARPVDRRDLLGQCGIRAVLECTDRMDRRRGGQQQRARLCPRHDVHRRHSHRRRGRRIRTHLPGADHRAFCEDRPRGHLQLPSFLPRRPDRPLPTSRTPR